ncbi:DnaJ domain-containing protein [Prosthecomicrobium sp. N25]|uniref:DnaJ domain-containing protein n=1 Tax=Prosthecomicrobium sp. N25 TaxID=3129254 RepID=UPI003077DC28
MNAVFLGAAVLIAVLFAAKGFTAANPASLAKSLRTVFGLSLMIFAAFMALTGRWAVAIPIAMFALPILAPNLLRGRGFPGLGTAGPNRGRKSTVRSAALEMELDHDSGIMSGRVLAGTFEGRDLARMSIADLKRLWREIREDAESRALLEAYMDRRDAFWREDLDGDTAAGHGRPPAPGAMTEQEAYQILGLQPGAGEAEIRDAHRRLMKAVHPDRGGSTFLAAKINEAKDRLIGKHRTRSNH